MKARHYVAGLGYLFVVQSAFALLGEVWDVLKNVPHFTQHPAFEGWEVWGNIGFIVVGLLMVHFSGVAPWRRDS